MDRNNKGQFVSRPLKECVYKGHEKDYKRDWYLKNKKRLLKRSRERYQENKERYSVATKLWQMRNAEKVKVYKQKNKDAIRFGGNRKIVLKRDSNSCQVCGKTDKLVIHHLDETENRKKMNANNNIDNLITLCRGCHIKVHRNKVMI